MKPLLLRPLYPLKVFLGLKANDGRHRREDHYHAEPEPGIFVPQVLRRWRADLHDIARYCMMRHDTIVCMPVCVDKLSVYTITIMTHEVYSMVVHGMA